jgi:GTP pyrophosphokinase
MITLDAMSPDGQKRIAKETQNVYVPLAKRCGLREVHHYLQGLSTEIIEPERWETMKTFVGNSQKKMFESANNIREYLQKDSWSKKILRFDTRFLSPFSVELQKIYHEESWYSIQIIVQENSDCYSILHDIGSRQDENLLQVGRINDLINQPRLSAYEGLHFDVIFQGIYKIKIRVLTDETYKKINSYPTFNDLGMIYSPILFRDFELINEATASDSQEFMQSVTEHILARKIPLHSA